MGLYVKQASHPPAGLGRHTGTMAREKGGGKFSFIQQDTGEEDMFVMPLDCEAFGSRLPPIGTRVIYDVTNDDELAGAKAGNVEPEPAIARQHKNAASIEPKHFPTRESHKF